MKKASSARALNEVTTGIARLLALSVFTAVIWLSPQLAEALRPDHLASLKRLVLVIDVLAIIVLARILHRPRRSRTRFLISTMLDTTAIAGGLYLGEGALAPAAALYLWTMIGRGFASGMTYMYIAAGMGLGSFGLVYLASPYWQENQAFSVMIASTIVLLLPYLAVMFSRMYRAEALARFRASHDHLTRVLNRRAFRERLATLLADSATDDPATEHQLLFLDLDEFKPINDRAGHAAGDKALRDVCQFLKAECTEHDFVGRMGGDEFCILLHDRSLEGARVTAERIRNTVAGYRLAWGTAYYSLGVSIGVASSSSVADEDAFVRLADAACYAAKNAGRNQVHTVDPRFDVADTQAIRKLSLDADDPVANAG